jgi:hypothetical protein
MRLHKLYLSTGLLALMGLAGPLAFADSTSSVQYMVTVNTTSILGDDGYIDFQMNPTAMPTQAANADVANFFTVGVLDPAAPYSGTSGEVSGMLPGTVTLTNSETTNEYTEGMTPFGRTITFDLDLYGPALSNPNGEGGGSFYLSFLDPNGNPLLTTSPQGDALEIDINGNGTTSVGYQSPEVTLSGPEFVPEPGSMALLLFGGLAAFATLGRMRLAKIRI